MRKFTVFCLSSIGAMTLLAGTAAAGAAGLWMYTERGACGMTQDRANTHHTQWMELEGDVIPAPVPLEEPVVEGSVFEESVVEESVVGAAGVEEPAVAVPGEHVSPAPTALQPDEELLTLKAQLAAALQRIAELESDAAAPGATPETPAPKRAGGDF